LANEIQISPNLLEIAIEWYAKNAYSILDRGNTGIILKNKFGVALRKKVKECFFEKYDDKFASPLGSTLADIFLADLKDPENRNTVPNEVLSALKTGSKEEKCIAILGMMGFAFRGRIPEVEIIQIHDSEEIFGMMFNLLKNNDHHYQYCISWCVAWSADAQAFPSSLRTQYVEYLTKIWTKTNEHHLKRVISWALAKILIPAISKNTIVKIPKLKSIIFENYQKPTNEFDKLVAIYLGTIIGIEFNTKEINDIFNHEWNGNSNDKLTSFSQFAKVLKIDFKAVEETEL
jgi:hypothetical protein